MPEARKEPQSSGRFEYYLRLYSFADKIITGVAVYLATLPENISDSWRLELTILIFPPCFGIWSCVCVWVARACGKVKEDMLQEEVVRTDPSAKKILE